LPTFPASNSVPSRPSSTKSILTTSPTSCSILPIQSPQPPPRTIRHDAASKTSCGTAPSFGLPAPCGPVPWRNTAGPSPASPAS
jgi:hypothetical protein